jgi:hypothetical protein
MKMAQKHGSQGFHRSGNFHCISSRLNGRLSHYLWWSKSDCKLGMLGLPSFGNYNSLADINIQSIRNRTKPYVSFIAIQLRSQSNQAHGSSKFDESTLVVKFVFQEQKSSRIKWNFSSVKTAFLPWMMIGPKHQPHRNWRSFLNPSNFLIEKYFDWVGDRALCEHVNNLTLASKWQSPLGTRKCRPNASEWSNTVSLDPVYLKCKKLDGKISTPADQKFKFFDFQYTIPQNSLLQLHIIPNVIVTYAGDVINGQFKLVACGCGCDLLQHQ